MAETLKGLEFDPGFGPYILAFTGSLDYIYADINKYKNFSQKKLKFMQYHKKILELFNNNAGFYVGCLLWAAYIKTQPKQEILSNHCYGQKYNKAENITETELMMRFSQLFPKDMKYFLGQNFAFDEKVLNLLKVYQEFLDINKGFTETKYNDDILLPEAVKTENAEGYKAIIDDVLKTEDLSNLLEYLPTIL